MAAADSTMIAKRFPGWRRKSTSDGRAELFSGAMDFFYTRSATEPLAICIVFIKAVRAMR